MTRDDMTERLDETVRQAPQPQGGNRREGLLEGLSMSQVVATALAAVTSMLLSSQIGIAGSIIGVAAASVVSTVAAQVYKGVLSRSADKLRELRDTASAGGAGAADVTNPYAAQGSTPWDEMAAGAGEPVMGAPAMGGALGEAAPSPAARVRIAPEGLREEAAERRQARLRKRVAVAALVAGLAAVAVTAGVIMLATHGEGIGTKSVAPTAATATTAKAASSTKATTNAAETSKAAGGQGSAASAPTATSEAAAGSGSSEQAAGGSAPTAGASTASAAGSGSEGSSGSKGEGASGSGSEASTTGSAGAGSASGSGASAGGSSSGSGDTAR